MTEEQKKGWAAMEKRLMPPSGKAETVAGEIIRAVDRLWYRWYNDGDKINVGYGKETCNGSARYLEAVLGAELPLAYNGEFSSDVWGGQVGDDDYTGFTEELVEEVFHYLKAHPELETKHNDDDSRTDFIDVDLDRDDSGDEDEECED